MDQDRGPGAPVSAHEYCELDDGQLRAALRGTEKRLRRVEEDHVELRRAYRDEIDVMRRELLVRFLRQIAAQADPLSPQQRRELHRRFERRAMVAAEITLAVRAVSRGRTERLDALTEIEAMALLLRLEREA